MMTVRQWLDANPWIEGTDAYQEVFANFARGRVAQIRASVRTQAERPAPSAPPPFVAPASCVSAPKQKRGPAAIAAELEERRKRSVDIVAARRSGMTLRDVGKRFGIGPERVRQICAKDDRIQSRRRSQWRPVTAHGRPDFNDSYDVDHASTPRDVYFEDRLMRGKDVGP